MLNKPVAEACLRNQQPIFEVLNDYLPIEPCKVFEIGSGTGQHAVYVADRLAHVQWQPSDVAEALAGIAMWAKESAHQNVLMPLELDVNHPVPVTAQYDAVFSANTIHFVSENTALKILQQAALRLKASGLCFVYGPFNEASAYTSEGNRRLDQWLKMRDSESGIKELDWVLNSAREWGMTLVNTHAMPANNKMLVFKKEAE